jgi:N-acyl-D-amino-acid deacylase
MYDLVIRGGTVVDGTGGASFTGDVAVNDGLIASVGKIDGHARRVVDADGALVLPGWVDGHTHYDGQVTWDESLEGSATNGVTTVVMGNCGVGFAPVAPGGAEALIDLMEGVEDIPGIALAEGMPWGEWESFPEYIDFLDRRAWSLDVGTQVAHGALRFYVMGERAITHSAATGADLERMSNLVEGAVRAGALGFSTSRITGHQSISGYSVPGTYAAEDELLAIARAIGRGGGAVLQAIPAGGVREVSGIGPEQSSVLDEVALFGRISREVGHRVTFTTLQVRDDPEMWRRVLAGAAVENERGGQLFPMVAPRAVTTLTTLRGHHLFQRRPTFLRLEHLPFAELVGELRRTEVRSAILSESDVAHERAGSMENILPILLAQGLTSLYPLRDPIDYEPTAGDSMAAQAAARNVDPEELVYDYLLEEDGTAIGITLGSNYFYGNLDDRRTMLLDANTVPGLSDAGAHVKFVCDVSSPTFNLTHWVRDRTRGERLPLEFVVERSTSRVANLFGLNDRGTIEVGKRADLNVVDFDNLKIQKPTLHQDLPAGGSRFLQPSTGYVATMVNGVLTREHDVDTGARPGRVARRAGR